MRETALAAVLYKPPALPVLHGLCYTDPWGGLAAGTGGPAVPAALTPVCTVVWCDAASNLRRIVGSKQQLSISQASSLDTAGLKDSLAERQAGVAGHIREAGCAELCCCSWPSRLRPNLLRPLL